MPRYFFHIRDGVSYPDEEGVELPDLDAARSAAAKLAGLTLHDDHETFWKGEEWRVDVTDEAEMILFSLHFMAVNAPCVGSQP